MSLDLHDSLLDLADEVGDDLAAGPVSRSAWAAEARRRSRARLAVAGAVLAVMALLVGTVTTMGSPPVPPLPAGRLAVGGVGGYPERIEHRPWVRDLPAAPGPVAGFVWGGSSWLAISERGQVWRWSARNDLDSFPAVSNDGRFVGSLSGEDAVYTVDDLSTGHVTRYPQLGCGCGRALGRQGLPYFAEMQVPGFWSPDDRHLLVWGGSLADSHGGFPLLDRRGHTHLIRLGGSRPAGWGSASEIVSVTLGNHRHGASAVFTDLAGRTTRQVPLHVPVAIHEGSTSQWTSSVSPDGTRLAVAGDPFTGVDDVAVFDLADGTLVSHSFLPDRLGTCPAAWKDDVPAYSTSASESSPTLVSETGTARILSVVDPRLDAYCTLWAGNALSGTPHGNVFGTSTASWTWWWREIAVGLVPLILAGGALIWWWRRRRVGSP